MFYLYFFFLSLPTLPGKVWNPFTDQTSETFIYQRRYIGMMTLYLLISQHTVHSTQQLHYSILNYFIYYIDFI